MNNSPAFHLYRNPLHKFLGKGESEMRIIVLGFNGDAQDFLDLALSNGQIYKEKLSAQVFAESAALVDEYLSARPALENFFSINAISTDDEDYGEIFFDGTTLTVGDYQKIFSDLVGRKPHYVFIALQAENRKVALVCKKVFEAAGVKSCISFIEQDFKTVEDVEELYTNDETLRQEIEAKAFNVHLIYEKNLNVDFDEVKREFSEPYNHDSSLEALLAIKSKLYTWGIDLNEMSFTAAASAFLKLNPGAQMQNDFLYTEHKRFVVEKICKGYRRREIADCADGETKDKTSKTHVCLVRCRADRMLRDSFSKEDWDSNSDLTALDELDRVSVLLHRLYIEQAALIKTNNVEIINKLLEDIRFDLDNDIDALISFSELKLCFEAVFKGDEEKILRYKGLMQAFREKVKTMPSAANLAKNLESFERMIKPLFLSMEYRDLKNEEQRTFRALPFILTYSEKFSLIIPFTFGDNLTLTQLFQNVASATVVNPGKIFYLTFCKNRDEFRQLSVLFAQKILAYMKRKKLRANVEFLIFCGDEITQEQAEEELVRLTDGRVTKVRFEKILCRENPAPEIIDLTEKFLQDISRREQFVALEFNDTALANQLMGRGLYSKKIPSFAFDSVKMKFTSLNGCERFSYIDTEKIFITASDVTALSGSFGWINEQPTFESDYLELWKKYRSDSGCWKWLCDRLGKHSAEKDILVKFALNRKQTKTQHYRYLMPTFCFSTIGKILAELKDKCFLDERSFLQPVTPKTCEVQIFDKYASKQNFDKLFSEPYKLVFVDALKIVSKSEECCVMFEDLKVAGLDVSEGNFNAVSALLQFLSEKNYLTNLRIANPKEISFTYATGAVKDLLINAGRILEIYVYHEVKKHGQFDDAIMSFEPHWNNELKNEFDLVLSKNFRMMIVECKAKKSIKQETYYKLRCLADKFALNPIVVLVTDSAVIDVHKMRGDMLQIVTIDLKAIERIGDFLRELMN